MRSDIFQVQKGQTYDISAWFLDNTSEARSKIALHWGNADGSLDVSLGNDTVDDADWQFKSFSEVAPGGATNAYFNFRVKGSVGESICVDDVNITAQ